MDQSFSIAAERLAAQHCAELTAPRRSAPDHGAGLSRFARRMALVLPDLLAGFGDDMHFAITAMDPCCGEPAQMLQGDGQGFSHVVLATGKSGDDFVLSIERRAVLEMLDRAFGGDGRIAGALPDVLPLSGQSILMRLERGIADVLAALAPAHALPALHIGRREDDMALLRPFVREDAVHRLALSVRCGDSDPWTLMITMRATMAELLAEANADKARRAAIAPHDAPFADIPLRLRATLIDMRLPLSRLGGLKPGDMIPVSVARSVPLALGDTIVAHGTVGEIDDRVALQITSAFSRSAS
ncbi:flagellar motor switch protein FliM [Croceicoccus sp. Ery5]|uniref:FliM/FliN family flagellar motor switch protein n=1 Tax=Croceicoccus sp. Ery5 TaxID=1703340 RepID=UPI001E28C2B5|nr:flagellar motor switch protein FliM [Croceicoccus sp. Ery5]